MPSTRWLKSAPCIIDATISCESCISGMYVSTMSSDSLQYILDCLNEKPYTNNGNDCPRITGYLHYLFF